MTDVYTIRPFRRGDLDGYLSLYRDVFGSRPDEAWFRWKYRDNPYADHVPIYVAEADGELVGARSFFALPVRAHREPLLAFQPCDTMVRADHRRRGLFTRMTEAAIEAYRDGEPDLFFNFPNNRTRDGNRKLGWQLVRVKVLYYRLQNPAAIARTIGDGTAVELASKLASPVASGYLAARDSLSSGDESGCPVERHETIPVDRLEALYRRVVPETFHVPRDERFLGWRFRNPDWTYETYVATAGGEDVAAVVTGTRTVGGITKTTVTDVLPRDGVIPAVLDRLLAAVLESNRDADLIAVAEDTIPREILTNRGFLPDDRHPLAPLTETTTLMVRPLSEADPDWTLGGLAVDDARNWATTFVSHDTE